MKLIQRVLTASRMASLVLSATCAGCYADVQTAEPSEGPGYADGGMLGNENADVTATEAPLLLPTYMGVVSGYPTYAETWKCVTSGLLTYCPAFQRKNVPAGCATNVYQRSGQYWREKAGSRGFTAQGAWYLSTIDRRGC